MSKTAHFVQIDQVLALLADTLAPALLNKVKEDLLRDKLDLPVDGLEDLTSLLEALEEFKSELGQALADFRQAETEFAQKVKRSVEEMPDQRIILLAAFLKMLKAQKVVQNETESLVALLTIVSCRTDLDQALKACEELHKAVNGACANFKGAIEDLKDDGDSPGRQFVDDLLRLLNQYDLISVNCLQDLPPDVRARVINEMLDDF